MNISLTQEDFKLLVAGKVIKKGDVQIALQDIGYTAMLSEIGKSMNSKK